MADSIAIWISKNNKQSGTSKATSKSIEEDGGLGDAKNEKNTEKSGDNEGGKADIPPSVELHFNYWNISENNFSKKCFLYELKNRKSSSTTVKTLCFIAYCFGCLLSFLVKVSKRFFGDNIVSFLDVGVKYQHLDGDVCIYFPFKLKEDNYDGDLCMRMCKEKELLSTLFNNSVKTDDAISPQELITKISFFKDKDGDVYLVKNLSLNKNGDIGSGVSLISTQDGGCCLTFPQKILELPESDKNGFGYFRFRVILDKYNKEKLSTYYKARDRYFTAKDEMIEIIDFRINEIRNIPPQFKGNIAERDIISSVHFFAIREVSTEFLMSDDKYSRCRLLEGPLWEKYLESKQFLSVSNIPLSLIYHWKKKGEQKDGNKDGNVAKLDKYTAFAKFRYSKFSIYAILRNILVILVLALLANMIYSIIADHEWFEGIVLKIKGLFIYDCHSYPSNVTI
ncbi:TPA: hypothetical protein ACHWKL_003825 [Providencia stuartii]|nr:MULTISPECIES: hypothetical protein [Providencia]MBN5561944.1 hypothetical protein [Providencia stuartii]MBN5601789.1 hypothetical protein [Providencia stuartii]MBN5605875.1 hypothetical protein [Providencia stuartii]MDF4175671.1 hypothetical protein [Providencia thailandensis]QUC27435.1 hypothetical protein JY390_09265 [Providencia stuartii]